MSKPEICFFSLISFKLYPFVLDVFVPYHPCLFTIFYLPKGLETGLLYAWYSWLSVLNLLTA
jgi:hypothetical protein